MGKRPPVHADQAQGDADKRGTDVGEVGGLFLSTLLRATVVSMAKECLHNMFVILTNYINFFF